jgi:hypothetical protein
MPAFLFGAIFCWHACNPNMMTEHKTTTKHTYRLFLCCQSCWNVIKQEMLGYQGADLAVINIENWLLSTNNLDYYPHWPPLLSSLNCKLINCICSCCQCTWNKQENEGGHHSQILQIWYSSSPCGTGKIWMWEVVNNDRSLWHMCWLWKHAQSTRHVVFILAVSGNRKVWNWPQ